MVPVCAPSENMLNPANERQLTDWLDSARAALNSDPTMALSIVDRAICIASAANATGLLAHALRLRGQAHGARGDIQAADADFHDALERARSLADRRLEAECLHGISNVSCYRGEYGLALEAMHQSVAIHREISNEVGLMGGLNSLGAYHGDLGNYAEAVTYLTDALQIARRLGDRATEAMALGNIGYMKIHCGEPEYALDSLVESARIGDDLGDRVSQSLTLNLLANAYYLLHRLPEALAAAQRAVQLAVAVGNQHHEVITLPTLAAILAETGRSAAAAQTLERALALAHEIGSGRIIASIYLTFGEHCLRSGDDESARRYLELGVEFAEKTQQKQFLTDLYRVSAEVYELQGDYRLALRAYRAFTEADRALQKESAQNRLVAQLARLEVDRAQQEAEIHRLRTVELAELNRENSVLLTRLREHADKLARLAVTDPLTGLYNRRYLEDYLGDEPERRQARFTNLALAIVDLDNFKQVNDLYGHHAGDAVLQLVADLLQITLRQIDITVRSGGEEFVVLLPETCPDTAAMACERVRAAIESYDWSVIRPDLKLTASIGVCHTDEPDVNQAGAAMLDLDRLLAVADTRLYQAKELGKNLIVAQTVGSQARTNDCESEIPARS